jgi:ribose 5-phosphate isomerase B
VHCWRVFARCGINPKSAFDASIPIIMAAEKTIAIAADHAGFRLKAVIKDELESLGYVVLDLGTDGPDSVDYPDYGDAIALALKDRAAPRGIIVCGTGIGIAIAANRHPHVRAAVCHDVTTARAARQHNDANVLALGARIVGEQVAKDCLHEFLTVSYEGGRHDRRVAKLGRVQALDAPRQEPDSRATGRADAVT